MSETALLAFTLGPTIFVLLVIGFGIRGFRKWRAKDLEIRDKERDESR